MDFCVVANFLQSKFNLLIFFIFRITSSAQNWNAIFEQVMLRGLFGIFKMIKALKSHEIPTRMRSERDKIESKNTTARLAVSDVILSSALSSTRQARDML